MFEIDPSTITSSGDAGKGGTSSYSRVETPRGIAPQRVPRQLSFDSVSEVVSVAREESTLNDIRAQSNGGSGRCPGFPRIPPSFAESDEVQRWARTMWRLAPDIDEEE